MGLDERGGIKALDVGKSEPFYAARYASSSRCVVVSAIVRDRRLRLRSFRVRAIPGRVAWGFYPGFCGLPDGLHTHGIVSAGFICT